LQALKQDWMVDRVESCRKIQEDQRLVRNQPTDVSQLAKGSETARGTQVYSFPIQL